MALLRKQISSPMAAPIILLALAAAVQAQSSTTAAQQTTAAATSAGTATNDGSATTLTDLPNLSTAATVGASTVSVTDAPTLSSSIFHLSDVPTIAGYGVPTQVVPWTAGAPYMQTSKLPEGTVFIIVGAVLGFLGAAILVWRGIVAWSLDRSVKRANLGTHYNDSMLKLTKPSGISTSTTAMGSNLSLDRLSAPAGKLSKPHGRNVSNSGAPPGSSAARQSSLFFSPTAGAGAHHASSNRDSTAANNRASAYLPAGYYAAPGAAAPNSGSKHASVGGLPTRLSTLNPSHPSHKGYSNDFVPSPPDSPSTAHRPSTGGTLGTLGTRGRGYERVSGMGGQDNWSNLNIPGGAPQGQRAPSANLEDLFEHHGNGMRGA